MNISTAPYQSCQRAAEVERGLRYERRTGDTATAIALYIDGRRDTIITLCGHGHPTASLLCALGTLNHEPANPSRIALF